MIYSFIKRLFDIVISLIVLPFIFILSFFIAFLIKLEDGGKVLYISQRIGKDFKVFGMYKFRTMMENAPNILNEDGSTYNSKDDFRVTKVGKYLRETSLDELPQFWNVLKGDMNIIGPRPGDLESIDTYQEDEKPKMKVKPGITGYTQAYFRNSLNTREKRLYDAWYAENKTILLDIKIFFKTLITVMKKDNIYTNNK